MSAGDHVLRSGGYDKRLFCYSKGDRYASRSLIVRIAGTNFEEIRSRVLHRFGRERFDRFAYVSVYYSVKRNIDFVRKRSVESVVYESGISREAHRNGFLLDDERSFFTCGIIVDGTIESRGDRVIAGRSELRHAFAGIDERIFDIQRFVEPRRGSGCGYGREGAVSLRKYPVKIDRGSDLFYRKITFRRKTLVIVELEITSYEVFAGVYGSVFARFVHGAASAAVFHAVRYAVEYVGKHRNNLFGFRIVRIACVGHSYVGKFKYRGRYGESIVGERIIVLFLAD